MQPWKIAVATQTPLIRAASPAKVKVTAHGMPDVDASPPQRPFNLNPGGVSRMVFDTVRRWFDDGRVTRADWFSLRPGGDDIVEVEGMPLRLHHLSLDKTELQAYARTKEKVWAHIHGNPAGPFDVDDFRFYSRYNWFTADAMLQHVADLDVAYVHDFQLLQTGALLGLAAPSVLRWHVPFDPAIIPAYTRNFLVRLMEDFDALIVSTQRDYQGLVAAGYRGSLSQIYPHINPQEWPEPSPQSIASLEEGIGLAPGDPVLLCVARMDPMKSQDVAIRAMPAVLHKHPGAKLVLVGNGSFSNARTGGLGMSKADAWSQELTRLVTELGLQRSVVFAHWVPDDQLSAAYKRADMVLLPSRIEGFGITVLEAWRYGKPCVVSSGAGAAEIMQEGEQGFVFPAGDASALAEKVLLGLNSRQRLEYMGAAAQEALVKYSVSRAAPRVSEVLQETIDRFGANGGRKTMTPPKVVGA